MSILKPFTHRMVCQKESSHFVNQVMRTKHMKFVVLMHFCEKRTLSNLLLFRSCQINWENATFVNFFIVLCAKEDILSIKLTSKTFKKKVTDRPEFLPWPDPVFSAPTLVLLFCKRQIQSGVPLSGRRLLLPWGCVEG